MVLKWWAFLLTSHHSVLYYIEHLAIPWIVQEGQMRYFVHILCPWFCWKCVLFSCQPKCHRPNAAFTECPPAVSSILLPSILLLPILGIVLSRFTLSFNCSHMLSFQLACELLEFGSCVILFFPLIFYVFLLKYSWFTMLCQFLLYSIVT